MRSHDFWRAMLERLAKGCLPGRSLRRCRWPTPRSMHASGGSDCASTSRPGSRRLRMRWRRPLAVSRPRVVLRSRQRAWLDGPLGLLRVLPAAASGTLHSSSTTSRERVSRETARRDVPAARARVCRVSDEDPRADGSLVVVVPRRLRQQCRLGFICLGCSPVIYSFQAVLLRLVHLTL